MSGERRQGASGHQDFVGPQVLRMTPSSTAGTAPQQIQFQLDNNDLNPASVTETAFELWQVDRQGRLLADFGEEVLTREYDPQFDQLTLTLSPDLPAGRYQVTVRDSISNLSGLALDGDGDDSPGGECWPS